MIMYQVYQGRPKTDIQRMIAHYGVSESEAVAMIQQGELLPPRGTGLMRLGLGELGVAWPVVEVIGGGILAALTGWFGWHEGIEERRAAEKYLQTAQEITEEGIKIEIVPDWAWGVLAAMGIILILRRK